MAVRFLPIVWLVIIGLALTGCGDDGGRAVDRTATSTSTVTAPSGGDAVGAVEPLVVPAPADADAGTARVAIGAFLDVALDLSTCTVDAAATPDGPEPATQVRIRAEGTTSDGEPVVLDVVRFVQDAAALTITDTVTVLIGPPDAPTTVVQAQRFELDGLVSDGRDPAATSPLLRIGPGDRVAATGIFAPPGNFAADGGLVHGAMAVTCG